MRLEYRVPCPALRRHLSVHALATADSAPETETLPAMLANLHIRLEGESHYRFAGGDFTRAPRVALIGPTTAAYQVALSPGARVVSVGLLPLGWMTLARLPAGELKDRLLDGADLWGPTAVERLCDRLGAARAPAAAFAEVERFLLARLRPRDDALQAAAAGVDHWLETSPDLRLAELAAALDVGERHLRRLVLETHGASPKTLAMKYRSLRAAAALSLKGPQGLDDALPLYADQAHLIRDFRRFVGWTPGVFAGRGQTVAAATLRGRHAAGAGRPLVLLS